MKTFLKLVEIQTKTASQFPFIFGTLFAVYRFGKFNLSSFILMFVSLLFFDMTTTTLNNYMDYKKAKDEDYRKNHNIIGISAISEGLVKFVILFMLAVAMASGILLIIQVGYIILFMGAVSFFIGVFYTFGPIPISRMPLGEILSGFFMGFVILYLSVYIHEPSIALISFSDNQFLMKINILETLYIFIVSARFVISILSLGLALVVNLLMTA